MARQVKIKLSDGTEKVYDSTLTKIYNVKDRGNEHCVEVSEWFKPTRVEACFPKSGVSGTDEKRCGVCDALNPLERPDSRPTSGSFHR